jgi:hypothetical protein
VFQAEKTKACPFVLQKNYLSTRFLSCTAMHAKQIKIVQPRFLCFIWDEIKGRDPAPFGLVYYELCGWKNLTLEDKCSSKDKFFDSNIVSVVLSIFIVIVKYPSVVLNHVSSFHTLHLNLTCTIGLYRAFFLPKTVREACIIKPLKIVWFSRFTTKPVRLGFKNQSVFSKNWSYLL